VQQFYEQKDASGVLREALKKALTELLVLYFLHQRAMYTYELIQEIKKQSDGYFSYNTLYIAIYRLQEKGYITEKEKTVTEDNRTRVYFALTPQGEQVFQRDCNEWRKTSTIINELLEKDGRLYGEDA
jgi:PadR family transcriptional regulator PadR